MLSDVLISNVDGQIADTRNTEKKIIYIEHIIAKIKVTFFKDPQNFFNHSSFQEEEMIYIYQNGEPIFWTDYHTHISTDIIKTKER